MRPTRRASVARASVVFPEPDAPVRTTSVTPSPYWSSAPLQLLEVRSWLAAEVGDDIVDELQHVVGRELGAELLRLAAVFRLVVAREDKERHLAAAAAYRLQELI